ncbi:hypothetical protein SJAG_03875 [Schizosaccharomyces japonicus yFS275]|uniref:Uncharacterized protein n=1 Tax=Schizosaccharomyces japonicus (strain yFS275 / FY16936) TaxID=402676 RepID=B6K5A5_SCHJY|nr:hypothetical protein SJAG_03875 [Schizosaccharomyces japonicus yFS275]EEB08709.2 hypothetical protein SJAG_03875 [Schizosaccharomyces japonicus yFS275]
MMPSIANCYAALHVTLVYALITDLFIFRASTTLCGFKCMIWFFRNILNEISHFSRFKDCTRSNTEKLTNRLLSFVFTCHLQLSSCFPVLSSFDIEWALSFLRNTLNESIPILFMAFVVLKTMASAVFKFLREAKTIIFENVETLSENESNLILDKLAPVDLFSPLNLIVGSEPKNLREESRSFMSNRLKRKIARRRFKRVVHELTPIPEELDADYESKTAMRTTDTSLDDATNRFLKTTELDLNTSEKQNTDSPSDVFIVDGSNYSDSSDTANNSCTLTDSSNQHSNAVEANISNDRHLMIDLNVFVSKINSALRQGIPTEVTLLKAGTDSNSTMNGILKTDEDDVNLMSENESLNRCHTRVITEETEITSSAASTEATNSTIQSPCENGKPKLREMVEDEQYPIPRPNYDGVFERLPRTRDLCADDFENQLDDDLNSAHGDDLSEDYKQPDENEYREVKQKEESGHLISGSSRNSSSLPLQQPEETILPIENEVVNQEINDLDSSDPSPCAIKKEKIPPRAQNQTPSVVFQPKDFDIRVIPLGVPTQRFDFELKQDLNRYINKMEEATMLYKRLLDEVVSGKILDHDLYQDKLIQIRRAVGSHHTYNVLLYHRLSLFINCASSYSALLRPIYGLCHELLEFRDMYDFVGNPNHGFIGASVFVERMNYILRLMQDYRLFLDAKEVQTYMQAKKAESYRAAEEVQLQTMNGTSAYALQAYRYNQNFQPAPVCRYGEYDNIAQVNPPPGFGYATPVKQQPIQEVTFQAANANREGQYQYLRTGFGQCIQEQQSPEKNINPTEETQKEEPFDEEEDVYGGVQLDRMAPFKPPVDFTGEEENVSPLPKNGPAILQRNVTQNPFTVFARPR